MNPDILMVYYWGDESKHKWDVRCDIYIDGKYIYRNADAWITGFRYARTLEHCHIRYGVKQSPKCADFRGGASDSSVIDLIDRPNGYNFKTMTETEAKLREALKNLYDAVLENDDFKGWKRGQNTLRQTELALGYIPRKSPYGDTTEEGL